MLLVQEDLNHMPLQSNLPNLAASFFDDDLNFSKWEIPFEHLQIGDQIGAGAFGVVYNGQALLKSKQHSEKVAVKTVRGKLCTPLVLCDCQVAIALKFNSM